MTVILLDSTELQAGELAALAVHPLGGYAYLGRRYSMEHAREELVVVSLDAMSGKAGRHWFLRALAPDYPVPAGIRVSIPIILCDPRYQRLFVLVQNEDDQPALQFNVLPVYTLDAHGLPQGEPRTYDVRSPSIAADYFQPITGAVYAYAFFPGWQYWVSPDRPDQDHYHSLHTDRLPRGWDATLRSLAIAPCVAGGVQRAVLASVPGVDVCLLQSSRRVALILLNWNDVPISMLELIIPGRRALAQYRIRSAQDTPLQWRAQGRDLVISLALKDVDIVLIEP